MNIDSYYQRQRCRPLTLVSGDTRFMWIFAEVPQGVGNKRQWGCRQRQFSGFSRDISSETLEMRPALLYSDTQSIISFLLISKYVPLNGLDWLFHAKLFPRRFGFLIPRDVQKIIAWKLIKTDTYYQQRKSLAGLYSFWRYKVSADIRSGSLERRGQRTVWSRVNARFEHLFLAFETNCVKLHRPTDRPIP